MRHETFALNGNEKTTLTTYLPSAPEGTPPRPLVLVCPGGGFMKCSPREGEPVALHFARAGYNAAVLTYATSAITDGKPAFAQALRDLAAAILLVRSHAGEWGVDPDAIAMMGFSAGGRLSGVYAGLWGTGYFDDMAAPEELRPNALMLCYGGVDTLRERAKREAGGTVDMQSVTGSSDGTLDMRTFWSYVDRAMYGHENPTPEEATLTDALSHVSPDVPPTFVWQTADDPITKLPYTLQYVTALYEQGTSCELHVFDHGEHGLSLADATAVKRPSQADPHVAHWAELAVEWLGRTFPREG